MKNVYVSQKIEQQLPEWVSYQLWYILSDYGCFRDERQKCLRIVQRKPPSELGMSFLAEQPVSAYRDTASGRAGRYDARRKRKRMTPSRSTAAQQLPR